MNLNTAGAPAQIFVNPFNFPTSPVVLNSCPCQSTQMIDRQTHSTNSVLFWVVVALLVCCFCLRFGFSSLLAAFLFKFCLLNLFCLRKLKKQAKTTSKFKKTKPHQKKRAGPSALRLAGWGARGGINKYFRRPGRRTGPSAKGGPSPVLINCFGARAARGAEERVAGQALY